MKTVEYFYIMWYNFQSIGLNIAINNKRRAFRMKKEVILSLALDVGEQMLVAGAEVYRVEDCIKRICCAYGAKSADVFGITSSIVVTMEDENGEKCTETRRVTSTNTNLAVLDKFNDLSRKICAEKPSAEEVKKECEDILRTPRYSYWAELSAYALICSSFTLFFGGSWIEALVSLIVSVIVKLCVPLGEKLISNRLFDKFLYIFIACVLAFAAVKMGVITTVDNIIIGNIMPLIPGIALTNSMRDLIIGDVIVGLLRLTEALLMAVAIAGGYVCAAVLNSFFG